MGMVEVVLASSKIPSASSVSKIRHASRLQHAAMSAIDIREHQVYKSTPEYGIAKQWMMCALKRV